MIRAADYIVQKISEAGVQRLYLVTGRGILYLSDAAAKHETLRNVPMHHEQACAYAAYADSAYTGKLSACLVSTGCAGTNALTGLLCAWQDDIPVIFVSGQNTLKETVRYSGKKLKTWGQQENDIISLVKPLTKYAAMLTSPGQVVYETEKALYLAVHGRKGPVWLDIPLDIQNMRIDPDQIPHYVPDEQNPAVSEDAVSGIVSMMENAERPVILFGHGIKEAEAESLLLAFAEKNGIPVAYSTSAPDIIGYEHPLCMGSVGMMGCMRSGAFAVQNSDFLLVIGNRLSPMTTGAQYEKFARQAKIIVIDIDPSEHEKETVQIDKYIHCDAAEFLLKMTNISIKADYSAWREKCVHWKKIFPVCEPQRRETEKIDLYYLAEILSQKLPSDAVLLTDAGLEELILPANVCFSGERRCIHPVSQGAMGFALPAIVGAYLASEKPVLAVIGDGSVMMNLQELATIAYQKLPVKLIIINNQLYAVIRKRQKELFRTRTIGTDMQNGVGTVDFRKIAECFGMAYQRIETAAQLPDGISRLLAAETAVICEVMGLENQDYTACAYARNAQKRFVNRPLEDQAPFLERELFLSEMVIPPIDQ